MSDRTQRDVFESLHRQMMHWHVMFEREQLLSEILAATLRQYACTCDDGFCAATFEGSGPCGYNARNALKKWEQSDE